MAYEWDPDKARANRKKHGVDFADAALVLEDPLGLTQSDLDAEGEDRLVTLGEDPGGQLLVVVWSPRGEDIRLISARRYGGGASAVRGTMMRKQYDFSKAKRGPVVRSPKGKTRITIRLDEDVLQWFKAQVHDAGGGSYQTLINAALRKHIEQRERPLEETLRRVLREELRRAS